MILADNVISFAESNLGLTDRKGYKSGTLPARLALCVNKLRDHNLTEYSTKTVKTVAGQGEYPLDEKYDKVKLVLWPALWLTNSATSLSHSAGSDITHDVHAPAGGPKWVTSSELQRWQQYATAQNQIGTIPIFWSHWKNEDQKLVFAVADKGSITADLDIILHLLESKRDEYDRKSNLPLEPHYELLISYMLCEQGAMYMRGEAGLMRDWALVKHFDGEAQRYKRDAEEERRRIERDHAHTQFNEVRKIDTPFFPTE